jgi:DNA-binding NarL/FixJ family response regulator
MQIDLVEDSMKVYLVEDSAAIREALIQRIEEDPRFSVTGYAETAAHAISKLGKCLPDVLILDLHLKQGTGYDILAYLHRPEAPADLKTFVLTNYATPAHRRQAMALGASDFFDKSMQFDELLDSLRNFADERNPKTPGVPPTVPS